MRPDIAAVAARVMNYVGRHADPFDRGFVLGTSFSFVATWPGTAIDWDGLEKAADPGPDPAIKISSGSQHPVLVNRGTSDLGTKSYPLALRDLKWIWSQAKMQQASNSAGQ